PPRSDARYSVNACVARRCPTPSFGTVNTFIQWSFRCACGSIVIARRSELSADWKDAMKSFANCHNIQYAIIRASSTHDSRELLVLTYTDEKSLRSIIAEPSIIARIRVPLGR